MFKQIRIQGRKPLIPGVAVGIVVKRVESWGVSKVER